ncbi:unnamed protein product [Plutella xylostella]|uniref:(diamondback moth) hypothetical protein n=1 Tax=Plutella xylostella TaxID=51655 RepID=A0A8S4GEN7_PLUXY|nr:unnamed protein product [Plutella xylostella]
MNFFIKGVPDNFVSGGIKFINLTITYRTFHGVSFSHVI